MQPRQEDSAPTWTADHDIIDASVHRCIGDYAIIEELGRGGMGVVYRARHRTTGGEVALKRIRSGELTTPDARRRFRDEIEAVKQLDHAHIVRVHEVGEHEGQPYYTMPLCTGSLDKQLPHYRDPVVAAELVAAVSRAVHHAHQRGVIHRDLKPANILLNEAGDPLVSDFGAAKRIGESGQTSQVQATDSSVVIGTPSYMAPERARGGDQGVTTAVDVFSLGVVLYQLLTGGLPFKDDSPEEMLAGRELEPIRPRVFAPRIPRALETICLKCLSKDPAARYRSAEDLADDLERFLRGQPIEARPANLAGRAWRFIRRHLLAAGTMSILTVVAVTAVAVASAQEQELQRDALRANAYAAHAFAGAVAFHLREQIDAVVAAAADPDILRVLQSSDREALERKRMETPFESITLYDRAGTVTTHAPPQRADRVVGRNYAWRDYFLGMRRLGEAGQRAGYISLAIRSEDDGLYKFGVVAPIFDQDTWVGMLLVTIGTDFALKRQRLDHASDAGPMAVVAAPRDRERSSTAGVGDYVVLLHEGLDHGAEVVIESPRLQQLRGTRSERTRLRWIDPEPIIDDAHHDPVPGYEGRWLAGFAPVGETGFVVIVQTRYDAAVKPNARLWRVAQVGVVMLAGVILGFGLWGYLRRRRWRARVLAR